MGTKRILNSNLIREGIFERNILEQKRKFQTNPEENIPIHDEFKFTPLNTKKKLLKIDYIRIIYRIFD